ncbi:MAG: hypothetical protein ACKV1O_19095 [Saprospiraceae bacterium]
MKIIEHIRKRPGMYIGEMTIRGLKTLLGYFFDDIINNKIGKSEIVVDFRKNNWICLKIDNVDTSLFVKTINNLENENEFVIFGLPVIIALSEQTKIKITHSTSLLILTSTRGIYEHATTTTQCEFDRIDIEFKLDDTIFKEIILDYEVLNQFIRRYAFINNNLKIVSTDSRTEVKQVNLFDYPNGILHQLDFKIGEQYYGEPFLKLDLNTEIGEYEYQICFSYQNSWLGQTYIMTYANYDELIHGGSLEQGVLEGIKLALQKSANKRNVEIDRRKIKEQLILIAVAKGDNFNFYGPVKTKLTMPKMRKEIKQYVAGQMLTYLADNYEIEQEFLNKHKRI